MPEPLTLERAVEAMARALCKHCWQDNAPPQSIDWLVSNEWPNHAEAARAALAALVKEAGLSWSGAVVVADFLKAEGASPNSPGAKVAALLQVLAEASDA